MYTIETLRLINRSFDDDYGINQVDVDRVNRYVRLIAQTRTDAPTTGDIIEYTDEYGTFSEGAHIEAINEFNGDLHICLGCPTSFVFQNDRKDETQGLGFETSGGGWEWVNSSALTYVGVRKRKLMVFGHCGIVANGTVYFEAEVNVWTYTAPNQMYPGYSTKNWDRQYISYRVNPVADCPYKYFGDGICFKSSEEYERWKSTYKAVEFAGNTDNQFSVFLYREKDKLVSREEWDVLDLPLDTRWCNGIIHVKVAYDDDAQEVITYRFTNAGYLDQRDFAPFERAAGRALAAPGPEVKEEHLYSGRKEF